METCEKAQAPGEESPDRAALRGFASIAGELTAAQREGRDKAQRIVARLRHGPEDFLEEIDREALRVCRACEEIAYPDPERARYERADRDVAFRCHFCDGRDLAECGRWAAWGSSYEGGESPACPRHWRAVAACLHRPQGWLR